MLRSNEHPEKMQIGAQAIFFFAASKVSKLAEQQQGVGTWDDVA